MSWRSLFRPVRTARPGKAATRWQVRPSLEGLEERTLMNNRFVVPAITPVDKVNTFATLEDALTTPGLNPGDIIQIEPGASPGNITNADLPDLANLTIQGDPDKGLAAAPQFTVSDTLTVGGGQTGLVLHKVSIGLVGSGSLVFGSNDTIGDSVIVDVNSSAATPVSFTGTGDVLRNSLVVNGPHSSAAAQLVQVSPIAGSNNVIVGNTFTAEAGLPTLLAYQAGSSTLVNDRVANNTFQALDAPADVLLQVSGPLSGLEVRGNTFLSGSTTTGLELAQAGSGLPQQTAIVNNHFDLAGTGSTGILVGSSLVGGTASATIAANWINTGGGTGLQVNLGGDHTSVVNLKVQGNDFHGNAVGVLVANSAVLKTALATGIDLGGGGQGSLGGNNFRSFTAEATATSGAIVLQGVANGEGVVPAQGNLFAANVTPADVTFDPHSQVDTTGPLTDNAAYVQTLYLTFLHRTGDTTNSGDAGGWVSYLDGGGSRSLVVSSIARSDEALGLVVDGLYLKILDRAADAGGRAAFVSYLKNGGTVEQAMVALITSGEFADRAGSDVGFIETLYARLLGRTAGTGELTAWLGGLPVLGRAVVAGAIVQSTEFRADVVEQMYGAEAAPSPALPGLFPDLLHRDSVTDAEVKAWAKSNIDLLAIERVFAGTDEFYQNG